LKVDFVAGIEEGHDISKQRECCGVNKHVSVKRASVLCASRLGSDLLAAIFFKVKSFSWGESVVALKSSARLDGQVVEFESKHGLIVT